MNEKTIFITGAGAGIGRAAARLFAGKGWYVGLYDINEVAVEALHQELGRENSCYGLIDVVDPGKVSASIAHFSEYAGGRMDVLLNNAGIIRTGAFQTIPLEAQHGIVDVNIRGVINCTYLAFPLLKSTAGAQVVNMASASSLYGLPEFATYSASKFFVRGITEALDLEWERYGIKVRDIMPPVVNTAMFETEKQNNTVMRSAAVTLSAEDVAAIIWQAVNGKRMHWPVTAKIKLFKKLIPWLPESFARMCVKRSLGY